MRALEDLKEMLEDQLKKITKKGDITPQELDSAYKVVDVLKDIRELSEQEQQMGSGGEYSQRSGNSMRGNSNNSYANYANNYANNSYDGSSYGPVWNREMMMPRTMDNMRDMMSNAGGSYAMNSYAGRIGRDGDGDGRYSETGSYDGSYDYSGENSYRRGRDARTGRYVSRDSGNSYERGNYSRHSDKERMLAKLENMVETAKSEKERMAIMQCIDKLED